MIIRNGRVMNPADGRDEIADIRVKDGVVAEIGELSPKEGEEIIDAGGFIVAPGLVDAHVHFRDPGFTWKEDIYTGAAAAASGGVTTVICMANTKPAVDNTETLRDLLEREKDLPVHVLNTATVTVGLKGTEVTDMEALAEAGAVGFTDDGIPIRDQKLLLQAFERAAALDLPISLHEEDPELMGSAGVNRGPVSAKLGVSGAPAIAEEALVARDCLLAEESGVRLDIQHVSSGRSVDIIRFMKSLGIQVFAEVTPQHFSLTEDAVLTCGTLAKVNPPIRTEADRRKLIEGLKDGTIDMIVTDHAPHTMEEKAKGFNGGAPSGMIGLETSLALGITSLVKTGEMTMMELLGKMTVNPADFYKLPCGRIEVGGCADLILIDPDKEWRVTEDCFYSKSPNSPFIGWKLTGKVVRTICSGITVYTEEAGICG
uniref:dihydroorotase n=1 Tax=Eubacterium cellulosolvens TaxID=29322 RepID=UPI000483313C|nr:dihydroorotase [[Eubacterium] cellulosolvens]